MKQSNQNEITALYCRLSQDDGADGESGALLIYGFIRWLRRQKL